MSDVNLADSQLEKNNKQNNNSKSVNKTLFVSLFIITFFIVIGFVGFNFLQNKDMEEKEPNKSNLSSGELSMLDGDMAQFGSVETDRAIQETILEKYCQIGNDFENGRGVVVGIENEKCVIATKEDSEFDRNGTKQWSWWYDAYKCCKHLSYSGNGPQP